MTVYPSISATFIGRLLGLLYDCIPIPIFGPKLSTLLFALPTAPLAALVYLLTKATGTRYILTNRSVQVWSSLGSHKIGSVELSDISEIELDPQPGQAFFRASDIRVKAANGQTLLTLPGVASPGAFRNAIQRAVQARNLVQSSMSTISARKV